METEQPISNELKLVKLPSPDTIRRVPLSAGSEMEIETHSTTMGDQGPRGVVIHWGKQYLKEELDAAISQNYGSKYVVDAGFKSIWRTPPGTLMEVAIEDELKVAQTAISEVLKINNLRPGDIDFIYLGSGAPLVDHPDIKRYSNTVASLNGMGHLVPQDPDDPTSKLFDRYEACYSGKSGFDDANTNPEHRGKIGLLLNMEGLTRFIPDMNPKFADPLSVQFFSNAASAMILVPGETFRPVKDKDGNVIRDERVVPDTKSALAARVPYLHLMDRDALERGELFQERGNLKMMKTPDPLGDLLISMNGGRTAVLFAGLEQDRMPALLNEGYGKWLFSNPERIGRKKDLLTNVHQAGEKVIEVLNERTTAGMEFQWGYVLDGNSSASCNSIALIRAFRTLKVGDHLLVAAMGAGSVQGYIIVEVGLTNLKNRQRR